MPTISRFSGLSISTPDAYRVEDLPATPAVSTTRRPRGTRRSGPVPLPAAKPPDSEVLLEALQTQDLTVVDRVVLEPVAPAAATSRAAPIGPQQTSIDLNVAPDEDAVLLLEQEGFYSWVLPSSSDVRPVVTRMRGMPTSTRQVRFTIAVGSTRQPAARRGLVTDFIVDRVRVYALKFVARIALGATVRFLERNVRRGLIVIPSKDPASWVLRAPADVKLPTGRPARVLLFVHGTFSSTVGSFGALAGTPWGQQFLDAAFTEYDAIIGYDHSTLADDPITNATDLLAALEAMAPQVPPRLDVVSFSRGGLVFRSLVEHLLPHSTFKCHIERAVFVGCTNAGTQLANPDNWQAFADLYTNLAVASFRLLSLMPQAAVPALVLKELIQGLGAFVKYLAASGTHDVPGLAAMRPDGDFVQTLNQLQQGQPQPGDIKYYAITSEFAPNAAASPGQTTELPHRLVLAFADGLVDRVVGEANDLVVNTRSMTAIDESIGTFLLDTFAFGPTPHVYHTIYFMRPEVVNSLARWFELSAPDQARRSLPPLPSVRDVPVPATVDTDFLLLDWGLPVGQAISTIDSRVPSYVIFNQPTDSKVGYYAMTPHEVMQVTGKMDPAMPIGKAIDFGSWSPSRERLLENSDQLARRALHQRAIRRRAQCCACRCRAGRACLPRRFGGTRKDRGRAGHARRSRLSTAIDADILSGTTRGWRAALSAPRPHLDASEGHSQDAIRARDAADGPHNYTNVLPRRHGLRGPV